MPVIEESKYNSAELMERVLELQNQHQELTDRVNHRVMEVATKIREDKGELSRLKQDKEEMERLEAQKRNFERNTTEKLLRLEHSLRKTIQPVKKSNASVAAVEGENCGLKQEEEALKSSASAIATQLDEVLARGKKNREMIEAQEKMKISYAEELEAEKRKSVSLKQRVEEAEDLNDQLEIRTHPAVAL